MDLLLARLTIGTIVEMHFLPQRSRRHLIATNIFKAIRDMESHHRVEEQGAPPVIDLYNVEEQEDNENNGTYIVAEDSEAASEIDKEGGLSESELADYGYEQERESGDWERKMKKGKMERAGKTIDELDVLGYYADYYI
jgi:hypothetical protein